MRRGSRAARAAPDVADLQESGLLLPAGDGDSEVAIIDPSQHRGRYSRDSSENRLHVPRREFISFNATPAIWSLPERQQLNGANAVAPKRLEQIERVSRPGGEADLQALADSWIIWPAMRRKTFPVQSRE